MFLDFFTQDSLQPRHKSIIESKHITWEMMPSFEFQSSGELITSPHLGSISVVGYLHMVLSTPYAIVLHCFGSYF